MEPSLPHWNFKSYFFKVCMWGNGGGRGQKQQQQVILMKKNVNNIVGRVLPAPFLSSSYPSLFCTIWHLCWLILKTATKESPPL